MTDLNPQEHIPQMQELSEAGEAQLQRTRAQLEKLDAQIADAPSEVERLQGELHTILLDPSKSPAHERKTHELQDAIRRTEQLASDRQAARGPLAQRFASESVAAQELRTNVTRAHGGALWHEFQDSLSRLDAALRRVEAAWTTWLPGGPAHGSHAGPSRRF